MPVGAAIGIGSVASAVIGGAAAKSAAKTQASAETQAANTMSAQYAVTRADLLPYNAAGQAATANIAGMAPFNPGTFDFSPTEAQLEATPGYQFARNQGLKSVQNSAAARGLGVSGAAQKGAETFATGLADTTYQNQFANALSKYQANYTTGLGAYTANLGREQNLAGLGENAGAQTGNFGTQTSANIGQTQVGSANAQAAGTVGAANAAASGINGVSNAFLLNRFFGAGTPTTPVGMYAAGIPGAGTDLAGLY